MKYIEQNLLKVSCGFQDHYMIVQSSVDDPDYLTRPMITSPNFRKQKDDKGWNPEDCWVPRPTDAEAIGYQ